MSRCRPAASGFAALVVATAAGAQEHAGHHHEAPPPADAPIIVTINPESRVSVRWIGPTPPFAVCGSPVRLAVAIRNEAFVTAPLWARIVGLNPPGVNVHLDPAPLTGSPTERRDLDVTLERTGSVDLTLEFTIPGESPDLAGRSRVHFLLDCT